MRQLVCDPNTEVIGASVKGFIENLQAEEIHPFLEKHGFPTDVQADQWYSYQKWLDVLNDIGQNPNAMQNMVAIGISIAQIVPLPPEVEQMSLGQVLEIYNDLGQAQFRNGDPGQTKTEKIADQHYKIITRTLTPDSMVYATLYGLAKRFLPTGSNFKVSFDETVQRLDDGGEKTVIHVQWE